MAASTAVTWEDAPQGDPASAKLAQIASLTGLRGFAALMVVLVHVSSLTDYPWMGIPDYGPVSLFVLSGFLLFRPWCRWALGTGRRPSVGNFALRRVARIFPAYLVVLVAVALVYAPSRPDGPAHWLRAATLTWIYHTGDYRVGMQHTWSLGTELAWYVALPVFGVVVGTVAARRSPRHRFLVVLAFLSLSLPSSAAWRWWIDAEGLGPHFTYIFWLPGFLFCFASGALVALVVEGLRCGAVRLERLQRAAADPWTLVVIALAVVLLATSPLGGPPGLTGPITFAEHQFRVATDTVFAAVLLMAAVLGPARSPLNRLLGQRAFVAVGRWSYGIYLWHLPVLLVLHRDFSFPEGPAGLVWRLALTLAISVPLSAATYAWVELPAIAWSRRRTTRPDVADTRTPSQPRAASATPSRKEPAAE